MKVTQSIIEMDISHEPQDKSMVIHWNGAYHHFQLESKSDGNTLQVIYYPDHNEVNFNVYRNDVYLDGCELTSEQAKTLMACLAHILSKADA